MSERIRIRLMRDGKVVQDDCKAGPAHRILVPLIDEPQGINARDMFVTPPVAVLLDKYNPKYEHWWADRVARHDVYKRPHSIVGPEETVLVYEYETTETRTVKDYDRVNPKYLTPTPSDGGGR